MTGSASEYETEAVISIQSLLSKAKKPCLCFSGGKNSLVLLHMVKQLAPNNVSIVHVDTGREFPSVRSYIQKMQILWNLDLIIEISQGMKKNDYEERKLCCKQFLFEPLKKIIRSRNFDGILTGETSDSDGQLTNFLQADPDSGLLLVQPLISFNNQNIWKYIRFHNLPFCSLYEKGYSKIDCEPCSPADTYSENESARHHDEEIIMRKLKKLGYL